MDDHFVLLVDRLLTESTLEAAIESGNHSCQVDMLSTDISQQTPTEVTPIKRNGIDGASVGRLVQCRICHDVDEDCSMESPCSCCGSLKYAHRICVQKWCNEKGNTICEICLQEFKPGYTAPPHLFPYSGVPMNFRGNGEVSRRDLHDPRLLARDDYEALTARSAFYCRSVVLIFMVLLIFRHTLPIMIYEEEQYSLADLALIVLRIAGVLVPIYVMAYVSSVFYHRSCRQQTRMLPTAVS